MDNSLRDASIAELIGGLVADVRLLARQSISLARAELREELERFAAVAALVAAAAAILGVAALWLLVAVTRGLAALFGWPVWGVYAGVGLALAVVGIVLAAIARDQIDALEVLPRTRGLSHDLLNGSDDGLRRHPR